ncbi:hypothetical protein quinque_010805 [Culex quinquefasciatus]
MYSYFVVVIVASCLTQQTKGFVVPDYFDFQVESQDAKITAPELAIKYGYRAETHKIQTEDGYLLELHRITGSGSTAYDKRLPPILLMHGLLTSSADWLLIGPGNGLAYHLSDLGFDVWLGNARGNRYCRSHVSWTPNMVKFWDFSWHEIGVYDLPAIIDHVLESTGKPRLHYIGHSQGTTTFFVMASERPEYSEKVILMQALAPVAYMKNIGSPLLRYLVKYLGAIESMIDFFGLGEFKPIPSVLLELAKLICPTSQSNNLCLNVMFLLAGANPDQIDPVMVPIILGHIPAGSSTKQLVHFGQEVLSGQFRRYDYGKVKNLYEYGQVEPPAYNLTRVTTPVVLHYGANDYMAHVDDVRRLATQLPNLLESHLIELDLFNHMDFLFAKDAVKLLYNDLVNNVEKYTDRGN